VQSTQFSLESQKTYTFFLLLCNFPEPEPMFLPTQLWFQPTSVCRKVLTRELEARNGKLLKIKGAKGEKLIHVKNLCRVSEARAPCCL